MTFLKLKWTILFLEFIACLIATFFGMSSSYRTPANVYKKLGGGIYALINCSTTGVIICDPPTVPPNENYYIIRGSEWVQLPQGTPLFKPQ